MAVKTITIDMEAYGRLKWAKHGNESFSDVIKRMFKPPVDIVTLVKNLNDLSDEAVNAIEQQVEPRRTKPARKRRVA